MAELKRFAQEPKPDHALYNGILQIDHKISINLKEKEKKRFKKKKKRKKNFPRSRSIYFTFMKE